MELIDKCCFDDSTGHSEYKETFSDLGIVAVLFLKYFPVLVLHLQQRKRLITLKFV